MNGLPSFDDLVAARESLFVVGEPGRPSVELQLTEVSDRRVVAGSESFSIVFAAPSDPLLAQGMVELRHETLGSFELFIVPISRDTRDARYEAVFSRLVKQPA